MQIDLTLSEKARLSSAARQAGLTLEEFVKRRALENLPAVSETTEEMVDAKLRAWQEQDGKELMPDISTQTLFAQWAEEDAQMTDAEREVEDRLWEDIEQGLAENGGRLQRRHLG